MRHFLAAAAIAVALGASLGSAPFADAQEIERASVSVPIDQSVRLTFAAPAADVVVANPAIADISLLGSGAAVVMGKAYGSTMITAFDAAGRTVFARQVVVVPGDTNRVALYRGTARSTFVCGTSCEQVGAQSPRP
jgi:Flp pilus assembly secretin CpaC